MSSINLNAVTLDYWLYSVKAQSVRNAVFNLAVGGKLFKAGNDVAVLRALSNITFNLTDGDRLGLVGHNGSGKTTLLKVLAGIYEPEQGSVSIKGRVTSMIALGAGLDPEVSGIQNIRNLGTLMLISRKMVEERLDSIIEFSELAQFIHLPVKTYSAGMLARLMFSVATELDPQILILDEWLSAGDAAFNVKAAGRMSRIVENADIVVMASHSPSLVKQVCNKVAVMESGQMVFLGGVDEWVDRYGDPDVKPPPVPGH